MSNDKMALRNNEVLNIGLDKKSEHVIISGKGGGKKSQIILEILSNLDTIKKNGGFSIEASKLVDKKGNPRTPSNLTYRIKDAKIFKSGYDRTLKNDVPYWWIRYDGEIDA